MSSETYIIETLEIELNRLRYEERSSVHYTSMNENGQVPADRWSRIHALEKAVVFHKKLRGEGKTWDKCNQFNATGTFWPPAPAAPPVPAVKS